MLLIGKEKNSCGNKNNNVNGPMFILRSIRDLVQLVLLECLDVFIFSNKLVQDSPITKHRPQTTPDTIRIGAFLVPMFVQISQVFGKLCHDLGSSEILSSGPKFMASHSPTDSAADNFQISNPEVLCAKCLACGH